MRLLQVRPSPFDPLAAHHQRPVEEGWDLAEGGDGRAGDKKSGTVEGVLVVGRDVR
jgi:hypothetical protein